MRKAIKKLKLDKNKEEAILAAIKTGKSIKKIKNSNKNIQFFVRINKREKIIKVHILIYEDNTTIKKEKYTYFY